jgi:hypothetical protein
MASSASTAGMSQAQAQEEQDKKIQLEAMDKALTKAADSCEVSMDCSTACAMQISQLESGDTNLMRLYQAMAAGGPDESSFESPIACVKSGAKVWADEDVKFIEDWKAAKPAVLATTQQQTDRYPPGTFDIYKRMVIPSFLTKNRTQLEHIEALDNLCRNGYPIDQADLVILNGYAGRARESYAIIKEITDLITAEISKQQ